MTACPAAEMATASDTRATAHVSPLGSDTTASHRSRFAARRLFLARSLAFVARRRLGHVRGIGLLRLDRLHWWLLALENHPLGLVIPASAGVIALADTATQHLARQRGLQLAADQPLELARAEFRLVAFLREVVDQRLIEGERHALAGGVAGHTIELQADDMADLFLAQRVEDDDFVDAVDELGAEVSAQH